MLTEVGCISNHLGANGYTRLVRIYQPGVPKVGQKSVFFDLRPNGWRYSLAVETSFFTLYVSYLNLGFELCSCKSEYFMGRQS